MANKPNIRFKGFTDDWEHRKLKDFADYKSSSLTIKDYKEEGKYDLYDANQIIGKTDSFVIDEDYITIIKDGAGVGRTRKLSKNTAFIGTMGALTVKNSDLDFLYATLNRINWGTKTSGSTIPHIYFKDYGEEVYGMPSIEEQQKIGDYFKQLDTLITLHQRKCDETKKLKKFMLQKMFPKNGEKIPEIRFAGFTNDWEQRKFGDIGAVAMCRRIFKHQTSDSGEIPFYKIGTFGGTPDAYISKELFEEFKAKYPYPDKGDILISASGSIGRTVEFTGQNEYFQDSNIVWLKHDKSIINPFLRHLYEVVKWAGIEGSTIKRLYNDNILKTEIIIPSVQEQAKIAEMLDGIDHLITLHQREL